MVWIILCKDNNFYWKDQIIIQKRFFFGNISIRGRQKALRLYQDARDITLPEEVLKGREFEDFVLELFDLNKTNAYSLLEWRGDKSTGELSPVSNSYPDFVLEYKDGKNKRQFAVECKWRISIPKRMAQPLFLPDQIIRYQEYSKEKGLDVFVILGIGGEPSMPEELYLIPLDSVQQIQAKPSLLVQFKRMVVDKWFSIEEFDTTAWVRNLWKQVPLACGDSPRSR